LGRFKSLIVADLEGRGVIEGVELLFDGLGNGSAVVASAHTPQAGDTVNHFSAIVGGEVHAVSRHKNTRILLEMAVGRERQPLVVHVDLKCARCALSFLRRHVIASLQIKCQKLDKNSVTP
jgi:hypothetical protein